MSLDDIINDGLNLELCFIRDLTNFSKTELKQEKFKIIHYDIDNILIQLEDYINSLPAPGIPLSISNRIVINNTRHILEGMSVVFDVHINHITRGYSNWIKNRERRLAPGFLESVEILKPKRKPVKKPQPVSDISDTHELPDSRGNYLQREDATRETFFDEIKLLADGGDESAAFEQLHNIIELPIN